MDEFIHRFHVHFAPIPYVVVVVATIIAGITDVVRYKVYNKLTFPLIVSGIVYHSALPGGAGITFALPGAVCGFAILILFYLVGAVGAGDVKLLAGTGAWVGTHDVLVVFIVAGLLTGLYTIILILSTTKWATLVCEISTVFYKGPSLPIGRGGQERVEQIVNQDQQTRRRRLIPFATLFAVAVLILLVSPMLGVLS